MPAKTELVVIHANELEAIIERAVEKALARAGQSAKPSEWVRARDCGLPATTRKRGTREGWLTTARVGRELMVKRADVDAFIERQRVQPREGDEIDALLAHRGAH